MAVESGQSPIEKYRRVSNDSTERSAERYARRRERARATEGTLSRMSGVLDRMSDTQMRQALGWFSIGIGLAAVLAPRALGRLTGIGPHAALLRTVGVRELSAGAGLLSARDAEPWLWSRVAGDSMDLMVLGASALKPMGSGRTRSLVSLALVAGVAAVDVTASMRQSSRAGARREPEGITDGYFERSIVIGKSPQECYAYWRNLSNAAHFMSMIDSVEELEDKRSHWVARMTGRKRLEWEARITEDLPGERIAWHSSADAPIVHAGVVAFEQAPGNRGTVVRLTLHYRPPSGAAGRQAARVLGWAPAFQAREDLRRFKQILETGEIATTRGQPSGRRSLLVRVLRAGRPA